MFIGRSRWSGDQGLVRKDMEQFMNMVKIEHAA